MSRRRTYLTLIGIGAVLATWITLLVIYGPQELVDRVGVQNSYIAIAIISAAGGLSSFTAATFYAALITFATGGSNPYLLGLAGGLGLTIGDSIFYYLGWKGRDLISGRFKTVMERIRAWIDERSDWFVPVLILAYIGFSPLPNDLLMVALALSRVTYKHIVLYLVIGNIIHTSAYAILAQYGFAQWPIF